jgi:hypothetical protein
MKTYKPVLSESSDMELKMEPRHGFAWLFYQKFYFEKVSFYSIKNRASISLYFFQLTLEIEFLGFEKLYNFENNGIEKSA